MACGARRRVFCWRGPMITQWRRCCRGGAILILTYALATSSGRYRARVGESGFGRTLKWAVAIRSGCAVVASVGILSTSSVKAWFALFRVFDIYLGILSVEASRLIWGGRLSTGHGV